MPLYLSPYVGSGSYKDPFTPKYGIRRGWAACDLRPDAAVPSGFCLLYSPEIVPGAVDLEPIADESTERLSLARRDRIFNALGESFGGKDNRVDTILKDLLFVPRAKWNPVQPSTLRSVKEVVFDGQVWAREAVEPLTRSTMDPSDDFNRANETPLAGNWSSVLGTTQLNLAGNEVLNPSDSTLGASYWSANPFADDQYSEIVPSVLGHQSDWSAITRASASAITFYMTNAFSSNESIYKAVAGSFSQIAAITTANVAVNDVVRSEAEGSTISWVINGISQGSTTDSAIASGSAGLFIYSGSSRITSWSGADLGAAVGAHGKINQAFLFSKLQGLVT